MASAFAFKVPSIVPQDLQIIRDIVGELPTASSSKAPAASQPEDDHEIASSDSDSDSEREVEADILNGPLDDDVPAPSDTTSDSDTSSDSDSDSDTDDEPSKPPQNTMALELEMEDDEEAGPAATSDAQLKTKNEVLDVPIVIPDIEEVGPHEALEKVGEVMSIVDKVVIVKGLSSELANRALDRALDSDTLLVFEDRKVFGYIYETFGPTTQPFYQVRFNDQYPLDPTKVQVSRPVFHVPEHSRFVFVRQLKQFKGSDASNVNDEEPAEDELEFSDDEQEAAHKRAVTQRRERTRAGSVVSSRHATPTPSQMRDQDMTESYRADPYDDSGPYDMDYGAGPSRPAPVPYDDPYSDSYGISESQLSSSASLPPRLAETASDPYTADEAPPMNGSYGRGQGRGKAPMRGARGGGRDTRGRGRGRGDRRQNHRGRGRGYGADRSDRSAPYDRRSQQAGGFDDGYDPRRPRSMSPTSLAIARATGQYNDGSPVEPDVRTSASAALAANALQGVGEGAWPYAQYSPQDQQYSDFSYGYQRPAEQQPYVQPHINPRFASAFAMQLGYAQGGHDQYSQYDSYSYGGGGYGHGAGEASHEWSEEWNGTRRPSESREDSWTGGS
ncbi:NAF1-domain-containing protein [Obba rivulosa]|uniref:H/ACA ribonucleoprotein complex non-core subunit NAF1 n=1 Tax=Obba rivulosa TaxID=1052685 RepID=A0A8E2AL79_9APHY|nr:NAF1-domain-containing protein [Obba rivulosa]